MGCGQLVPLPGSELVTSVSSAVRQGDKNLLPGVVSLLERTLSAAMKTLKAVMDGVQPCDQSTDCQLYPFLSEYSFYQPSMGIHTCKLRSQGELR